MHLVGWFIWMCEDARTCWPETVYNILFVPLSVNICKCRFRNNTLYECGVLSQSPLGVLRNILYVYHITFLKSAKFRITLHIWPQGTCITFRTCIKAQPILCSVDFFVVVIGGQYGVDLYWNLFFTWNVHRPSAVCNKIASNQAHHCCMSPAVWGNTVYHSKRNWAGCQWSLPSHFIRWAICFCALCILL